MSLRQRTPTAIVLLGIIFAAIQWGSPLVFFIIIQAVVLLALVEFYNLARKKKLEPRRLAGFFMAFTLSASFYLNTFPLGLALFGSLLLVGLYFLISVKTIEKVMTFPGSISVTVFGALYIGLTLNYFHPLRVEWGPPYLYFLFAVIAAGDTGAYIFGKWLGKHKMTPLASPHKTWEGSIAGFLAAGLAAVAAQQFLLKQVGIPQAALCGVLVHAVAQISDPLESLFKRAVGVKDSSNLLPGHGGFLDRVDSLLFAAPFFYYYLSLFWK